MSDSGSLFGDKSDRGGLFGDTKDQVRPISFDPITLLHQQECPLFSVLPGEVRDMVFSYALAEYEDFTQLYDANTCYKRPEYQAPRRRDTALLRTCQRIYSETWFRPWTDALHTIYLAWEQRRPARVTTVEQLTQMVAAIHATHGEVEFDSLHVLAQLCSLESGRELQGVLGIPHYRPRSVTITVRHTDWWSWDSDADLQLGGNWMKMCKLPDSVTEFHLQLESLERKKVQVDSIAKQVATKWFFARYDGTILTAWGTPPTESRWFGSSIWNNERWIRDETRPGTLDYYIATVTWRLPRADDKQAQQERSRIDDSWEHSVSDQSPCQPDWTGRSHVPVGQLEQPHSRSPSSPRDPSTIPFVHIEHGHDNPISYYDALTDSDEAEDSSENDFNSWEAQDGEEDTGFLRLLDRVDSEHGDAES